MGTNCAPLEADFVFATKEISFLFFLMMIKSEISFLFFLMMIKSLLLRLRLGI